MPSVYESQIDKEELAAAAGIPLVFAADTVVTEISAGASRIRVVSYDAMEQDAESAVHARLREKTLELLAGLGYRVYSGGVGVKGHIGFCDGAAIRDGRMIFIECLLDWAVRDLEQLKRKLAFAQYAPLVLVLTPKAAKIWRIRARNLQGLDNVFVLSGGMQSRLSIHHPESPIFRPLQLTEKAVRIEVTKQRTWATIKFSIGPAGKKLWQAEYLLREIKPLTDRLVGGWGRSINQRQKGRRLFDVQYIARVGGDEQARITLHTFEPDVLLRVRHDVVDDVLAEVASLSDRLALGIEKVA